MPEVTDLMRVAQYVKSDRGAPSDVYNAACRLLNGRGAPEAPRTPNHEGCEDPECYRIECLHLGTCWEDEFWSEGPNANTPEKGTESNRDGRTPQTLGTAGQDGAREAQEARE